MAAGLLDVREKKQQREQSVAGWLERSKSPQLMGVSNENTARAQAFTLSREVIFKLFARYLEARRLVRRQHNNEISQWRDG